VRQGTLFQQKQCLPRVYLAVETEEEQDGGGGESGGGKRIRGGGVEGSRKTVGDEHA
jgi:hypothetical protein